VIDINSETLLTLTQAARLRPSARGGRPTHQSSVYRWISRGLRGHKLEAVRVGGTLYTSREALQRWAERLTYGQVQTPGTTDGSAPQRSAQVVDQELDRFGI
jgi:hypothetical protein